MSKTGCFREAAHTVYMAAMDARYIENAADKPYASKRDANKTPPAGNRAAKLWQFRSG
jgi:hypothetical protein